MYLNSRQLHAYASIGLGPLWSLCSLTRHPPVSEELASAGTWFVHDDGGWRITGADPVNQPMSPVEQQFADGLVAALEAFVKPLAEVPDVRVAMPPIASLMSSAKLKRVFWADLKSALKQPNPSS